MYACPMGLHENPTRKPTVFKHKRDWKTFIHNFPTCSPWEIMNTNDAYLAGLIDGEGTVSLRRGKKGITAELSLVNTNPIIIDMFGVSKRYIRKRRFTPNSKEVSEVTIQRLGDILSVLKRVYPFLHLKKRRAELMIEFCELRLSRDKAKYSERELEIQRELHVLNRRGS